jgi:hypothetical protein
MNYWVGVMSYLIANMSVDDLPLDQIELYRLPPQPICSSPKIKMLSNGHLLSDGYP